MTDDSSAMDKKSCSISPLKLSSQDVSSVRGSLTSKQDSSNWPSKNARSNSRRPTVNPGNVSRGETSGRKPWTQKSKSMDKRPKPRGDNSGEPVVSKQDEPEMGSLQAPGGKKRNWDHLLGFHFPTREPSHSPSWRSHNSHPGRYRNSSGGFGARNKFNKDSFLQANCQFMVKGQKDYSINETDPDVMLEWSDVEQIFVKMVGEETSCPICLDHPIAAKMTRCGHIFCWPCMLHYLALSDESKSPCPICYECVRKDDLKSVVANICFDVEVGDRIHMKLMFRPKNSLKITPVHGEERQDEWKKLYTRLMIVNSSEIQETVINRERFELEAWRRENECSYDECFVEQAFKELDDREIRNKSCSADLEAGLPKNGSAQAESSDCKIKTCGSLSVNSSEHVPLSDEDGARSNNYYFYQAIDGQHIFLHPVNMAMLLKAFGRDMNSWPRELAFKVIEKEFYAASEETRKRWKFLQHLPLNTPFQLIEVEMKESDEMKVTREIVTEFKSQINHRKIRREERAKNEKHMEKMMEERERNLAASARPLLPMFESKSEFPIFGDFYPEVSKVSTMLNPLELAAELACPVEYSMERRRSEASGNPLAEPVSGNGPSSSCSFAQMAGRAPIKKSPSFPVTRAGTGKVAETFPTASSSHRIGRGHSDSEPDTEDHNPVPEFRESMSDAIAKAFETLVLKENAPREDSAAGQQKKKKKNKGKVLFATGGTGCYN